MVDLYFLNLAPKLRLLSMLLFRGTRRILGGVSERNGSSPSHLQQASKQYVPLCKTSKDAICLPKSELVRDPDYYAESRHGFCVFQVEDTLFNVHQVLLCREPSAFGDMLCLPQPGHDMQGTGKVPVFLTDTIPQFRHFLWALYAPPNDLFLETDIERLLDIAALANKYCFSSLEAWAIERIYSLTKNQASSPLDSTNTSIPGRILDMAILCDHEQLQELVTRYLISQILWCHFPPEMVLQVVEKHELRTLLGVCYYRQLVDMEARPSVLKGRTNIGTSIPPIIDTERQIHFLSAHCSLLTLWTRLRSIPPVLLSTGCPAHGECERMWQCMWYEAGEVDDELHAGSADILGRMKAMMLDLRKAMADAPHMTIECKMAALEAITQVRDEVIDGLVVHFLKSV